MSMNLGGSKLGGNIVTNNLLMYVNGGSGYSYRPSTNQTTWKDLSGNNNNMTIGANATFSSLYGGGLVLGAAGNVAVAPTINLSGNYSIAFWIKIGTPVGTSDTANIVTLGANHKFRHNQGAGGGLRQVYNLSNYANITDAAPGLYYITGMFNDSTDVLTMYSGTSLVGSGNPSGATAPGSVQVTLTGAYAGLEFYSVALYSSVLTVAEITQNYNATKTRFGL